MKGRATLSALLRELDGLTTFDLAIQALHEDESGQAARGFEGSARAEQALAPEISSWAEVQTLTTVIETGRKRTDTHGDPRAIINGREDLVAATRSFDLGHGHT